MSREPNPLLLGAATLGPPVSVQTICRCALIMFGYVPMHRYAARTVRQRAVLGCVRRKFMHRHGDGKRRLRKEPDVGTIDIKFPPGCHERRQRLFHDIAKIRAFPILLGQHVMGAGHRKQTRLRARL